MGLAFADRNEELEALSEANTLQLENLRIAATRANRAPVTAVGLRNREASLATHDDYKVAEGDADPVAEHDGDDGGGSLIPEGSLVLRQDRPFGAS